MKKCFCSVEIGTEKRENGSGLDDAGVCALISILFFYLYASMNSTFYKTCYSVTNTVILKDSLTFEVENIQSDFDTLTARQLFDN